MALVPLPALTKAPRKPDWQSDSNLIRDAETARQYWLHHPRANLGVCLEPSHLVSVDADYIDGARAILGAEGIDLDALVMLAPTIVGRNPRLEFQAPAVALSRRAIAWPPRRLGDKPVTVLEFRAGRVQDVLPPSVHPDTRRPYRWHTPPRDGFPPLPAQVLALWLDFEPFRQRALALCPWPDPRPAPPPRPAKRVTPLTGPSVVAEFNSCHDAVTILEAHGYERVAKRRWKSPNGHGVAGVVLLPDGKVFCHHTSDPLGDGLAHDAFDVFTMLEHGGDIRAAVREAARLLEIQK